MEVTAASFGGTIQASDGLLGTVTFRSQEIFEGTEIQMTPARVRRAGRFELLTTPVKLKLTAGLSLVGDLDGDGSVGFSDFLTFASHFGSSKGQPRFNVQCDFDGNDRMDFADFLSPGR